MRGGLETNLVCGGDANKFSSMYIAVQITGNTLNTTGWYKFALCSKFRNLQEKIKNKKLMS